MTAKEAAGTYRVLRWTELICECKASGKTIAAWCAEHSVNVKTYYYWQKRVREAACEQLTLKESTDLPAVSTLKAPSFTEYRLHSQSIGSAAVTLHLSGATMEIHNGADAAVIESTLKALKNIC
ncbi:MAG: IS66 family insertion sequence element accessory protein TnpB [Bacillota bacterium]|nr:IS66 family insertion sequence element accessory protein TnpB [Bacillota bacterium]